MKFKETALPGVFLISLEHRADERGYFARTYCAEEFATNELNAKIVQSNISFNFDVGTLRGLHWQDDPHGECKTVRCLSGAVWDVVVDLRKSSRTYGQHYGVELSAENALALYIPEQCAHGFITLQKATCVTYTVSHPYTPTCERGLRYNDQWLNISWPRSVEVISEKDRSWPDASSQLNQPLTSHG